MASNQSQAEILAYEAVDGMPDSTKQAVYIGYYMWTQGWTQYSYPYRYYDSGINPKYPQGSAQFSIGYSDEGYMTLGRTVTTYSNSQPKALVRREGDFEIRDDFKFILNTSSAQWTGVEGEPYFLQLQISTFAPSNTVFKLCLHQYFPGVRRLACTLHNKDTGAYRGTQVLDDSRGLGVTEYLPLNE